MRRFVVTDRPLPGEGGVVTLGGELYHHMVRVLRMGEKTPLILMDREGKGARGVIEAIDGETVTVRITSGFEQQVKPLSVTLCQALPKGEKLETVVRMGVEVGIDRFVLFPSARSVGRIPPERRHSRVERLTRIGVEAARQSGGFPPEVLIVDDFDTMLRSGVEGLKLMAWEEEMVNRVRDLAPAPPPSSVTLLVGPEGGFTEAEAALAKESGFTPVTLGPRILRTETAGIVLASLVLFRWGDLG